MIRIFDDAMRAAADLVAGVDRDVRTKLVTVRGREDRYTEKFATLLDERLSKLVDGGVRWRVSTHVSDKQSGQENRTGADLFIGLELDFQKFKVQKGIQIQSKINKNPRFGISVDSKSRLRSQCETMTKNTQESFVFLFGQQETKIAKAGSVLDVLPMGLSGLTTQSPRDFFYDFFVCRYGDRSLFAKDDRALQDLVRRLEYSAAVLITGEQVEG
jgi:hypothetical protein